MSGLPDNLVIRTGVLASQDTGYIYACDPSLESDGVPHAIQFKWTSADGLFEGGRATYDIMTACMIDRPAYGLANLSGSGAYTIHTREAKWSGEVRRHAKKPDTRARYGDFSKLVAIDGSAYAFGHDSMVFRFDREETWTAMDQGLGLVDIEAADGLSADDLCVAGLSGALWRRRDGVWANQLPPTNVGLTAVKYTDTGHVYAAGDMGVLLRGIENTWEVVPHDATTETIWDLEWFQGRLFVSTVTSLYELQGDELIPIQLGRLNPRGFSQLDSCKELLWSVGDLDVLSYDGYSWERVI